MSRKATVFNSILPVLMTDRYLPDNRLLPTGCGVRWNRKSNRRKTISTAVDAPSRKHRLSSSPSLSPLLLPAPLHFLFLAHGRWKELGVKHRECVSAQKLVQIAKLKRPAGLRISSCFDRSACLKLADFARPLARPHRLLNNGRERTVLSRVQLQYPNVMPISWNLLLTSRSARVSHR